jgi:hypothetical protein
MDFMLNEDYRANRKWMTAFGLANDGLDNWRVAVHPKDLEPVERASRNAIRTGVGFAEPMELQLRNMTKEGVWLDVMASLSALSLTLTDRTGSVRFPARLCSRCA